MGEKCEDSIEIYKSWKTVFTRTTVPGSKSIEELIQDGAMIGFSAEELEKLVTHIIKNEPEALKDWEFTDRTASIITSKLGRLLFIDTVEKVAEKLKK